MKNRQTKIIYIFIVLAVVVVTVAMIYLFFMKKDNSTSGTGTGDNFTCPTEKFINCMPQVGNTAKEKAAAERQNRYCDFVAKNCPGVVIAE